MKVDMINATIFSLRAVLSREGIEYERARFQRILDKTPSKYTWSHFKLHIAKEQLFKNLDTFFLMFLLSTSLGALRHTTSWLKSTMEEMMSRSVRSQEAGGQGKVAGNVPNPIPILNTAFLGIFTWDYDKKPLPEVCVAHSLNALSITKTQMFFCYISDFDEWWDAPAWDSVAAPAVSDGQWGAAHSPQHHRRPDPGFASPLWASEKNDQRAAGWDAPLVGLQLYSIVGLQSGFKFLSASACRTFNMEAALENASLQISCEINKSLTERNFIALTPALQANLRGQICSITQKDNPIRTLVGKLMTKSNVVFNIWKMQ